ncbi:MAG TPA: hypothetical protein PKW33_19525 [Anaerolineaceae bacterium]|nr:hypothetical protein [Anaerolineaceae bacterium]HPN53795.1 hypothetical protein [Anaerolineaceae bacterium]
MNSSSSNILSRIFRIQPEDTIPVMTLGLLFFFNSLAQQVSEITAISNFLSEGGLNQILIVWAVGSLSIFFVTGLQSLIVDRYNRFTLTRGILMFMAIVFIVLRLLFVFQSPGWLNYGILYLISDQQWLFLPLVFWTLSNDIFDVAQATRVFPMIASGDFIGKLVGIAVSAAAPSLLSAIPGFKVEELLVFNALLYLTAYIIIGALLSKIKLRDTAAQHTDTLKETLSEGWGFIREVPAFRFLAISILLVIICDTIVEFRFLAVSDTAFPDPLQYQTFYSLYRLGLTVISLLFQFFLTSRIISRMELKNVFLIEPLTVLLSPLLMLINTGIWGGLIGILTLKIPQITIGDSVRKAFQSLVPEERRGRVSIFMDSYLFCAGTLVGCAITGFILYLASLTALSSFLVYLGFAIIASAFSIWSILRMRSVYEASLLNWRLKRRQRGKSVLDKLEF